MLVQRRYRKKCRAIISRDLACVLVTIIGNSLNYLKDVNLFVLLCCSNLLKHVHNQEHDALLVKFFLTKQQLVFSYN